MAVGCAAASTPATRYTICGGFLAAVALSAPRVAALLRMACFEQPSGAPSVTTMGLRRRSARAAIGTCPWNTKNAPQHLPRATRCNSSALPDIVGRDGRATYHRRSWTAPASRPQPVAARARPRGCAMRRGRGYASLMLSGQNNAARLEGAASSSALRGALSPGPVSIGQMREASWRAPAHSLSDDFFLVW